MPNLSCSEDAFEGFIRFQDVINTFFPGEISLDSELLKEAVEKFGKEKVEEATEVWNKELGLARERTIVQTRKIFGIDKE